IYQQRNAFFPTTGVADGIRYGHLRQYRAICQLNCQRIGNGALFGVVVVCCELWILDTAYPFAESIYTRVSCDVVLIILCLQTAENQGNGYHVLDAVVAVGRVMQRPFFIDDANGGLMCADSEARNVC